MPRIERSTIIDAPVEKVFAYMQDHTNDVEWLPGMLEVKDLTVTEEGTGTRHGWVFEMAGLHIAGESTVIDYAPGERIVERTEGIIPSTWTWTFGPHDAGTKLDLVLEYTVAVPLLGRPLEALMLKHNEREADVGMANIKAKMEA